jgi:phage baseplate assembly protein W
MAKDKNSWSGYPYPIVKNANGYFGRQTGINQIKSDLLILLLTYPGERIFLPDFGTPLQDLIFEPNDATVAAQARQMIIASIKRWEPRITVSAINVTVGGVPSLLNQNDNLTEKNAILTIQIQFVDPGNLTEAQELVLDVPLAGA